MSYETALEAAGAKVIEFRQFGSYQGDWWALVHFGGTYSWVHGSFGSCSGCDAFEGEFEGAYFDKKADYQRRLAAFGASYVDHAYTHDEALKEAGGMWGDEKDEVVKFMQDMEAKHFRLTVAAAAARGANEPD